MPLLKFHLYEGRSPEDIRNILDVTHGIMVDVFQVPERDRYQIVHEHKTSHMIMQDTGLDLDRTEDFVLIHVFTRKRTEHEITSFYRHLVSALENHCAILPNDVMVSITTNEDEHWSFGEGKAQFLTGDLH
ncbi:tautomerase family protein [Salibacterium lacus]|uniref:Tautomerase family protein n=1 Tax=Salibacterium lacus TaxID=1898109 RepID=A0ABW5T2M9_9BACI